MWVPDPEHGLGGPHGSMCRMEHGEYRERILPYFSLHSGITVKKRRGRGRGRRKMENRKRRGKGGQGERGEGKGPPT